MDKELNFMQTGAGTEVNIYRVKNMVWVNYMKKMQFMKRSGI